MKNNEFLHKINDLEAATWKSFVAIAKNCLRNQEAEIYEELDRCKDV